MFKFLFFEQNERSKNHFFPFFAKLKTMDQKVMIGLAIAVVVVLLVGGYVWWYRKREHDDERENYGQDASIRVGAGGIAGPVEEDEDEGFFESEAEM